MVTLQEAEERGRSLVDQAQEARTTVPVAEAPNHDHEHGLDWPEFAHIAIVAIAAAVVWFKVWEPIPGHQHTRHYWSLGGWVADIQGGL
jgi:hypothetical protein